MSNEKEQLPEWVMDIIDQHYPKISRLDCPDETTYLKAGVTRMFCIVYGKRVATEIYSRMQEEMSVKDNRIKSLEAAVSSSERFRLEDAAHHIDDQIVTRNNFMLQINSIKEENNKLREALETQGWISVYDRPLITKDDKVNWICTEDGMKEFIAAIPYTDKERPDENNLWWVKHCVIEDVVGLCVVGDEDNEPAGFHIKDITHWMPWPPHPNKTAKQLINKP